MAGTLQALAISVILLFILRHYINRSRNPGGFPYPPGPRPLPLIGNINDLPKRPPWLTYTNWSNDFGDLVYVKVFGQSIVIVNSAKIAKDLFEMRSYTYSDRPATAMINLMGWDHNIAFIPYGDNWRQHRRIFHQKFNQKAALSFRPAQLRKVHELLRRLVRIPGDFASHLRHMAASIFMATVYGHEIQSSNDRFIQIAEQAMSMLSASVFPGTTAVNALPQLQHLPGWFPGTGFKQFGRKCHKLTTEMQNAPFDFVRKSMVAGTAIPSVTADLLGENDAKGGSKDVEEMIKRVSATIYAAGGDTTVSSLVSAILAMVLHPEAQQKAQAEIDRVVGNRLPDFGDRESLPYVEAFYREVLRWHPATPLGVAHAASSDDIYNGYFIPKGATVIGNVWAILHDVRIYSHPEAFNPERFLDSQGHLNNDVVMESFGFGRRVCPGRHMADATVWATVASVLSAFDLSRAKDETGQEIEISGKYTDGLISHPLPFECCITPRSDEWKRLVEETEHSHKA